MSNVRIEFRHARFWEYINGSRVKLTLKDGQMIRHGYSYPTEEGFHAEYHEWRYWDGVVTLSRETDGRDCDGRLSTHAEFFCAVGDLKAALSSDEGGEIFQVPKWQKGKASQRDYSAEAMGY